MDKIWKNDFAFRIFFIFQRGKQEQTKSGWIIIFDVIKAEWEGALLSDMCVWRLKRAFFPVRCLDLDTISLSPFSCNVLCTFLSLSMAVISSEEVRAFSSAIPYSDPFTSFFWVFSSDFSCILLFSFSAFRSSLQVLFCFLWFVFRNLSRLCFSMWNFSTMHVSVWGVSLCSYRPIVFYFVLPLFWCNFWLMINLILLFVYWEIGNVMRFFLKKNIWWIDCSHFSSR